MKRSRGCHHEELERFFLHPLRGLFHLNLTLWYLALLGMISGPRSKMLLFQAEFACGGCRCRNWRLPPPLTRQDDRMDMELWGHPFPCSYYLIAPLSPFPHSPMFVWLAGGAWEWWVPTSSSYSKWWNVLLFSPTPPSMIPFIYTVGEIRSNPFQTNA